MSRSPGPFRRLQRRGVIFAVAGVAIGVAGAIAGSGQVAAAGFAFAVAQLVLAVIARTGARR